jgi:phosphosulfolactate phosphohydrolase-like enzyme
MGAQTRTVLIDAFPQSAFRHRRRDALVCVDVMLSTTTLVSALAQGRRAFVAHGPRAARSLVANRGPVLLAGHPEDGAEVPDSPTALEAKPGDRRDLVLRSPPGTELIHNAAGAATVLIACLRNLSATVRHLEQGFETVAVLAAGVRQEFSCEDQMAAAWIAGALTESGFEAEDRRTAELIRRWRGIEPSLAGLGNSAAHLRRAGRSADVDFVLSRADDVPFACTFTEGEVRAIRKRPLTATLPLPAGDVGVTRGPV